MVWNFPFEVVYKSQNVSGWPQIVLTFTARNFFGKDVICGYGVTHVPTQPGTHTRYVHVFCPISSSALSEFIGMIKGSPAEFLQPANLMTKNEGREVTRVQSVGLVKVQFNVTLKGMHQFGIFPFKA